MYERQFWSAECVEGRFMLMSDYFEFVSKQTNTMHSNVRALIKCSPASHRLDRLESYRHELILNSGLRVDGSKGMENFPTGISQVSLYY